jgi:hypothetical protein
LPSTIHGLPRLSLLCKRTPASQLEGVDSVLSFHALMQAVNYPIASSDSLPLDSPFCPFSGPHLAWLPNHRGLSPVLSRLVGLTLNQTALDATARVLPIQIIANLTARKILSVDRN